MSLYELTKRRLDLEFGERRSHGIVRTSITNPNGRMHTMINRYKRYFCPGETMVVWFRCREGCHTTVRSNAVESLIFLERLPIGFPSQRTGRVGRLAIALSFSMLCRAPVFRARQPSRQFRIVRRP